MSLSAPQPPSLVLEDGFCGWEAVGGGEGPLPLPGLSLSHRHGSDRVDELVDEALGDVGFPDDAFLVILPDGAAQLVVVHGRAVLPNAPQTGHLRRVLDLEDAWEGSGTRGGLPPRLPPPTPTPGPQEHPPTHSPFSLLSQRMKRP